MSANQIQLFLLLLLGTNFYGLSPKILLVVLLPILIYYTVLNYKKKSMFRRSIIIFLVLLLISALTCYYFRGQPIVDTLKTPYYLSFYSILIYFYCCQKNFSATDIETVLTYLFWCFFICFMIQYALYPQKKIFNLLVSNDYEHRFRMMGQLINSIGYFYYLYKYFSQNRIKYLFCSCAGLLVIILLGFRMMIASCVITSLIFYFHYKKVKLENIIKVIFSIAVIVIVASYIPPVQHAINSMLLRQENEQNYLNTDYVRYLQFEYFFNKHFNNSLEFFLGSGMPNPNSQYGKMMALDIDDYSSTAIYGWYDWGMVGLTWIIGIPAVFCLLYIIIKCIKYSFLISKRYWYIGYWYIFLLIISVNNVELFRVNSFIFHGVILYLLNYLTSVENEKCKVAIR